MKSEKQAPRALKRVLVGYNGHTIYQIYLKDQKKVIMIKNLHIFEDHRMNVSTELLNYDNKLTFQEFSSEDNDKTLGDLSSSCVEDRKVINTKGK